MLKKLTLAQSTVAAVAFLVSAMAVGPAAAQDDPAFVAADPVRTLGIVDASTPRVTAEGLYWADYRLMEMCSILGGRFAKLNASAVYECRLPGVSGPRLAAN